MQDLIATSAEFAVARIRLLRRDRVRAALGEAAAVWAVALGAVLPWWLLAEWGDVPVKGWWRVPVFMAAMVFAGGLPVFLVWGLMAGWQLLMQARALPSLARWLLLWRVERQAEEVLRREGRIPAAWMGAGGLRGRLRRAAVDRVLALDPELVRAGADAAEQAGDIRVIGALPAACLTCGAGMVQIGPGLRQCAHCGYGRYDPPPAPSEGWRALAAAGGLGSLVAGQGLQAQLLAAHPWIGEWMRRSALAVAGAATAMPLAVGAAQAGAPQLLWAPVMMAAMLVVIPAMAGLGYSAWIGGTFLLERLPLRSRWRHGLRQEVLRLTGEQGALTVEEAAERLGMSPAALEPEVLAMLATGDLPIYHDRAENRLISRFCQGADTRCPACAGAVAPGPEGLRCRACGTVALPLGGKAAPGAPAAGAPVAPLPGAGVSVPAPEQDDGPPPEAPELKILLDTSIVAAGGEVRGRVRLRLPSVRRCDRVEVELQRRLTGDKKEHDELIYTHRAVVMAHAEVIGALEAPFVLPVPGDARSWAGKLVQAEWRVFARLFDSGSKEPLGWSRVIRVEAGRADPAKEAALLSAWRGLRRAESGNTAFATILAVVLIGLPCSGVWLVMIAGTVGLLTEGRIGAGLGLGALTGLVGLGAWELAKGWGEAWIARWLMGAEADLPPLLHVGESLQIPVRLRGRLTSARWQLTQGQYAGYTVKIHTRNGTRTDTRWNTAFFWYDKGDLSAAPGSQTVRLTVPEGVTGSVEGGMREFRWALNLYLESGRWKRTVSFPVLILPLRPPGAPEAEPEAAPAGPATSPPRP